MLRNCRARFISHEVTKKVIKGNRRLESRPSYRGYFLTAMSFVEAQCIDHGVKRNQE